MDLESPSELCDFILVCTDGSLYVSKHMLASVDAFRASFRFGSNKYELGVGVETGKRLVQWIVQQGAGFPPDAFSEIVLANMQAQDLWDLLNAAHLLCLGDLVITADKYLGQLLSPQLLDGNVVNTIFAKNFRTCREWVIRNFSRINTSGVDPQIVLSIGDKLPLSGLLSYIRNNSVDAETLKSLLKDADLGVVIEGVLSSGLSPEEKARVLFSIPANRRVSRRTPYYPHA